MKKAERIENRNGYSIKTTVSDNGTYIQTCYCFNENGDMIVFDEYKTTLTGMGWSSFDEFLRHKKQFSVVAE